MQKNLIKYRKAFTLVELIVVITILAILWTIGFLSFAWYSKYARNSVRLQSLNWIQKSIEIYEVKTWTYPIPTNFQEKTFSWWIVWKQGTIWKSLFSILKLYEVPRDPLTDNEYTYSILENTNQYQIWTISEWNVITINDNLLSKTYAEEKWDVFSMLLWNYNSKMARAFSWSNMYVLALPSIIAWDNTIVDIEQIITEKQLSFGGYLKYPSSYSWTNIESDWIFDFVPWNIVVYSWSIKSLDDDINNVLLVKNLQTAYSWTILMYNIDLKNVMDIDFNFDINNSTKEMIDNTKNIIHTDLLNKTNNEKKIKLAFINKVYILRST